MLTQEGQLRSLNVMAARKFLLLIGTNVCKLVNSRITNESVNIAQFRGKGDQILVELLDRNYA